MIQVKDLRKVYGPTVALDKVSFEVGAKQILGFLGPNGAGKSTAMKVITTYIAPTEGTVTVDGLDVSKNQIEVRRKIGYLPETNPLYADMQVDDYLRFCGEARGLAGPKLQQRLDWVVEHCGLTFMYKRNIGELSKGYKQRTGLAQALIHDPEILILDEPTSGLDPLQIIEIRKLIQKLAEEKTIIFSTHILAEVTSTTDRIIIINNGSIIADGYLNDLKAEASASTGAMPGEMNFEEVFIELIRKSNSGQGVHHA
jgi:ABC-2 type transport system ATP-binding protein